MYIKNFCFWAAVIARPLLYLYLFFIKASTGARRGDKRGTREERLKRLHQSKPKKPEQDKTPKQEQLIVYRLNSQQIGKKANPKM